MIIRYPTALYESVLPRRPEDSGNVTFTISSNDPPRPNMNPSPLQRGGADQPLPGRLYPPQERDFGELVFCISSGSTSLAAPGQKAFEVGEFLQPGQESVVISPIYVPDLVELQQNTNQLDLTQLGLTPEVISVIKKASKEKFEQINRQLAETQSNLNDINIGIQENQRLINEANKVLAAVQAVGLADAAKTLGETVTKLENDKQQLLNTYNTSVATAQTCYDELLKLREVIR